MMLSALLHTAPMMLSRRWRNFFESTAAVQFDHRVLALSTLAAVVAFWAGARKMPLPRQASMWSTALLHMSGVQVTLGISGECGKGRGRETQITKSPTRGGKLLARDIVAFWVSFRSLFFYFLFFFEAVWWSWA